MCLTLVTATDGNHGRAVSHMARLLGVRTRVYTSTGETCWADRPSAATAIRAITRLERILCEVVRTNPNVCNRIVHGLEYCPPAPGMI